MVEESLVLGDASVVRVDAYFSVVFLENAPFFTYGKWEISLLEQSG